MAVRHMKEKRKEDGGCKCLGIGEEEINIKIRFRSRFRLTIGLYIGVLGYWVCG